MESDLQHRNYHQPQQHQKPMNSGLTRYQSAPSSLFSNILDRDFCQEILNRPTSPETERIIARFLSSEDDAGDRNIPSIMPVKVEEQTQIMPQMNNQTEAIHHHHHHQQQQQQQQQQQKQGNYSSVSQNFYRGESRVQQSLSNQQPNSTMDYRVSNSTSMAEPTPMKVANGSNSSLVRHSSSPAGLFANINIENSYGAMRGIGDYGSKEAAIPSASRPPPSRLMSPRPSSENVGLLGQNLHRTYSSGFPVSSWDESMMISDNMSGETRLKDEDRSFSGLDHDGAKTQNTAAARNHPPPLLAHHLSLPKSSPDMSAIEKLLQYQEDSVPCKLRAKRGHATHPRSIAERVRRTKISERMRKLQDLVPNMDKQTNTADMLDLAVDYIKDLQEQVNTLSEVRGKCSCAYKQQQQ